MVSPVRFTTKVSITLASKESTETDLRNFIWDLAKEGYVSAFLANSVSLIVVSTASSSSLSLSPVYIALVVLQVGKRRSI
jgi:hypothetical protein